MLWKMSLSKREREKKDNTTSIIKKKDRERDCERLKGGDTSGFRITMKRVNDIDQRCKQSLTRIERVKA